MKITYDKTVDTAYMHFMEDTKVVQTLPVNWIDGMINMDFSVDWKIIGIEVIPTSQFLDVQLLNKSIDHLIPETEARIS